MIGRRAVLGGLAVVPAVARAQGRRPVVGVLRHSRSDGGDAFSPQFRRDMAALGWTEGTTVDFAFVWADSTEPMPALAGELATRPVDVIVVFGSPAVRAAQAATRHIPIVGMSSYQRDGGARASLVSPGVNHTGISILTIELDAKRLELLCEAAPRSRRVGVLAGPETQASMAEVGTAGARLGVELLTRRCNTLAAIDAALQELVASNVDAVSVMASSFLNAHRARLIDRLNAARLPSIFEWPEAAADGGLLGYGPRQTLAFGRLAALVDKLLRGARPADLPIEQPSIVELAVNVAVARAIGLTLPASILARADEVIE